MPRVVLAGNNLAAVYVLELLLDALDPAEVIVIAPRTDAVPDWHASLAEAAGIRGVECLTPANVNEPEIATSVSQHGPDLFLSVYYTQIFRGELMDVIRGRALNFHPSLLPRHRGNAPLIWAIVDGDRMTGVSVHHVDEGIDTGDLILQRVLPIHDDDTGYVLHRKMALLVRATAAEVIRGLVTGRPLSRGQIQTGEASSHSVRDPRLNHLVWTESSGRIRNIVRALAPPLPGAFAMASGVKVSIARVERAEATAGPGHKAAGMVEIDRTSHPMVWSADGPLRITSVVLDGREAPGSALVESGVLAEGQVLD